jgi:prepilin-type N-terminal cleavage/methylation domain-containing protein
MKRKQVMKARTTRGFTLLELMLAVSILAVVSIVTYATFSTVVTAWRRGLALTDSLHHGDYIAEQLAMGLRSAFYRNRGQGFVLEDDGEGPEARDKLSWVKLGGSLVGKHCPFIGSPHRVEFTIVDGAKGPEAAVKAWRMAGQMEDFDPEELPYLPLSRRITGFNCRLAFEKDISDEIQWMDSDRGLKGWCDDRTNYVPTVVEFTLYMAPPEGDEDQPPVEIKRIVSVPRGASGHPRLETGHKLVQLK